MQGRWCRQQAAGCRNCVTAALCPPLQRVTAPVPLEHSTSEVLSQHALGCAGCAHAVHGCCTSAAAVHAQLGASRRAPTARCGCDVTGLTTRAAVLLNQRTDPRPEGILFPPVGRPHSELAPVQFILRSCAHWRSVILHIHIRLTLIVGTGWEWIIQMDAQNRPARRHSRLCMLMTGQQT
jgi:hypothetical protein